MRIAPLVEPVSRAAGHVTGLGNALVARGHHVTRVERRTEPRAPACEEAGSEHLRVHRLDAGPPRPLRADERLLAVAELGYRLAWDWAVSHPEVVYTHGWLAGLAALAAARDLPASLRPLVVETFHGLTSRRPPTVGTVPDLRRTSVRPRLEAAVARGRPRARTLDRGARAAGCPGSVPAGRGSRADGRRRRGLPPRATCGTGRTADARARRGDARSAGRLDLAVRALGGVRDAELVVLPSGPVDGEDAVRLLGSARRHGVADRVHLLDPVPAAALPGVLRSADVLVRTRPDESIGRLVVQAMACGVPVVGRPSAASSTRWSRAATGVLVPPEDPRALAAALQALVTDPLRREGYGLAAVEPARTRYSWARLAVETERAYARARLRRSGNGAAGAARPGADAALRRRAPELELSGPCTTGAGPVSAGIAAATRCQRRPENRPFAMEGSNRSAVRARSGTGKVWGGVWFRRQRAGRVGRRGSVQLPDAGLAGRALVRGDHPVQGHHLHAHHRVAARRDLLLPRRPVPVPDGTSGQRQPSRKRERLVHLHGREVAARSLTKPRSHDQHGDGGAEQALPAQVVAGRS